MNTTSEHRALRIANLRTEMEKWDLDGYLVPRASPYLGEYMAASEERLSWLTGFTGSAGIALVLKERAVVMSDSRYTAQLKDQVDRKFFQTGDSIAQGLHGWLKQTNMSDIKVGFDPSLFAIGDIKRLNEQMEPISVTLTPINDNLIDIIWLDRPDAPHTGVEPFLDVYAGIPARDKIQMISDELKRANIAAAFMSDPSDLAWLLNVRARDCEHTPIALSRGVIYADGNVEWVIDPLRVPLDIKKNLGNVVQITPPEALAETIMRVKARVGKDAVLIDERATSYRLAQMMEDRNIALKPGRSPVTMPRACKTVAEQKSIREMQVKDSVALIRFLAWFDSEAPRGMLDEIGVAEKLLSFRKLDPAFRGPSFDTIAGFGPHGALPHYHATEKTNKKITGNSLLLLDSGGQYVGGTTDITRTLAVGEPSDAMQEHYTAVLKSHVAVARAVFPRSTMGGFLDGLARAPLWAHGLDFGHRLGHGVGCYLGVHEEAANLSMRGQGEPLERGMYVSNEPAYYRVGEYGIRLENLVLVVDAPGREAATDEQIFYALETVSLVPFDPALTKLSMLTREEKEWLATYHTRILETVGPLLPASERAWLETVVRYFC